MFILFSSQPLEFVWARSVLYNKPRASPGPPGLGRRRPEPGLLHHSDRGSQYAAGDYQAVLEANGLICSMSRKGNCWDNAPMESFFATLKTEFVSFERFATREEAKVKIFEYIEVFYNRERRHSSLGYQSPVDFESRLP